MKIFNEKEINELAEVIKNDGVVSVPTDTVFGICARSNSKKAFEKLVEVKKRPSNKSFPVMCLNEEQIQEIAIVSNDAEKIIKTFMPGPITIVLKKKQEAFSYINNRGESISDEVAVRIAPLKVLEELILKVGCPLFLTSANISGQDPCNSLDDIIKSFPDLDGVLEGSVSYGQSSTIVDCTSEEIKIQREGPISFKEINEALKKRGNTLE